MGVPGRAAHHRGRSHGKFLSASRRSHRTTPASTGPVNLSEDHGRRPDAPDADGCRERRPDPCADSRRGGHSRTSSRSITTTRVRRLRCEPGARPLHALRLRPRAARRGRRPLRHHGSGGRDPSALDPTRLPPLPAGWKRDFLVLVDGWSKDADANTHTAIPSSPCHSTE